MRRTILKALILVMLVSAGGMACGELIGLEPPPGANDGSVDGAPPLMDATSPSDGPTIGLDASVRDADAAVPESSDDDADATSATDPDASDATDAAQAGDCEAFVPVSTSPAMTEIAVGPNDAVWGIGAPSAEEGSADQTIYEWVGDTWVARPGGAVSISVAPDTGAPWIANAAGTVYELVQGDWQLVSSTPLVSVIAADLGNTAWAIGTTPWVPGSADLAIYTLTGGIWTPETGGALQISVTPDTGLPWIVNSGGVVFHVVGTNWTPTNINGAYLSWIAAGPGGHLWGVGRAPWTPGSSDFGIYESNDGVTWTVEPGGATRIAVAPTGIPWTVNAAGTVSIGVSGSVCPP